MPTKSRDFLIRKDGLPVKVLHLERNRTVSYMRRLQARFPDYRWSISERFLLSGSD